MLKEYSIEIQRYFRLFIRHQHRSERNIKFLSEVVLTLLIF